MYIGLHKTNYLFSIGLDTNFAKEELIFPIKKLSDAIVANTVAAISFIKLFYCDSNSTLYSVSSNKDCTVS